MLRAVTAAGAKASAVGRNASEIYSMAIGVVQAVIEARGLPPAQKAVLISLGYHAGKNGTHAFPSRRTIAGETGYTVRGVHKALVALESAGLIRRAGKWRRGHGKAITSWSINLPALHKMHWRLVRAAESG